MRHLKNSICNVTKVFLSLMIVFLTSCGRSTAQNTKDNTPKINVISTIFGTADTGNKSTLKKVLQKTEGPGDINIYYYDSQGNRVPYEEGVVIEGNKVQYTGDAQLSFEGKIDDSKIDDSNARVTITEGEGYEVDELILHKTKLDGHWENGQNKFTLNSNDLEWNMGNYPLTDTNSGREWSCFGGDGNGYYTFNFKVDGIKYDGKDVEPTIFKVNVYIWGRDASDMAEKYNQIEPIVATNTPSQLQQTNTLQWVTDNNTISVLCDNKSDNFYAVWANNQDGSSVTQNDVSVVLTNEYGDAYNLQKDQYEVFSNKAQTQVALKFQYWPYTPVFSQLQLTIQNNGKEYKHSFDVATVYAYMVQQGGGGVTTDGTVIAYSFYGLDNKSLLSMTNPAEYVLSSGRGPNTQYYAEDSTGRGYITTNITDAKHYDAQAEVNPQLVANTILTIKKVTETVEVTVDGQVLSLTKNYLPVYKSPAEMLDSGIRLKPGYTVGETWGGHEMWSWQSMFKSGWTPDKPKQTQSPYEEFPFGKDAKNE